jgi:hypothetical protein
MTDASAKDGGEPRSRPPLAPTTTIQALFAIGA